MSADPHRPKRAQDPSLSPPPIATPIAAGPAWPEAAPPSFQPPVGPPAISPMAPYAPAAPPGPAMAPVAIQHLPVIDTSATSKRAAAPVQAKPVGRNSFAAAPQLPKNVTTANTGGPVVAPVIAAPSGEEPPTDITEAAVKSAPPFVVSMFTHMVLIIILALITLHQATKDNVELKAVYAESLGQQLLDDKLQSPESLDIQAATPVLSFDLTPANDPLAAPPKLPDFFADANKATSNLDAPDIGMALTGREHGMKKALLPAYGGNETTEGAVLLGLEWLKRNQMKDGGWSLVGPYPDGSNSGDNRSAATAMALLAFQGYGATHKAGSTSPDFHDVVERGWNYLLKLQDKDGFFQPPEGSQNSRMYAQAQATIAICELYGMTKDPKFKRPAQLALDFAHKAQSPELGGWRYEPRFDSDTSVTGWYVMALQSGLMAGLEVQSPNLELINKFLDRVAREGGTQYAYQIGGESRLTMTAEALLCRQYLGWKHDDPRMRAGIDQLLANRINYNDDPNVYYWYYATQACHHMDGNDWNRWNEVMRQAVPTAQTKTGNDKGSWHPNSDRWGSHGGRLYTTCLSIFMLETYYRHLPIYKWRLQ